MIYQGGYAGTILKVDLTRGKIIKELLDPAWAVKYIGARGFGARILWDSIKPGIDPLGPENVITMASGPLSGLLGPSGAKITFVGKSPATGIYGDSNMGGMMAGELKNAGYDAVVLMGASSEPTYLFIDDDDIHLRSAKAYWGKGNIATEREIKDDIGDESVRVASIGPAGENLVKIAGIATEAAGRNAGRTGLGAVLGSKKVKAIAVRGNNDIPVADFDKLMQVAEEMNEYCINHQINPIWQRQGTMTTIAFGTPLGILPVNNFSDAHHDFEKQIDGDMMERRFKKLDKSCFGCPTVCSAWTQVLSGKHVGYMVEGPEYETAQMLGPNCGVYDMAAIIRGNVQCDDLGIDTISAGNLIAFAMEAYERGIITSKETGGINLRFGNADAQLALIEMIAKKEGIGAVLAEGIRAAVAKWGPETAKFAVESKGLEQSAYDTRSSYGMALAYATADVGAHHNRAWVIAKELAAGADWGNKERAELVIFHQHVRPMFDALGVCRFQWIELDIPLDFYARWYSAATGIESTLEDLLSRSEGVYNITRSISVREGISRKDDIPPARVFDDPVKTGPTKGNKLSREAYNKLLDLYYEKRGWDKKTGIPTREKLESLGLKDIANELEKLGKLPGARAPKPKPE